MANLRDIRRRIKSVKNTAQITRAMQLVAAAKMKKAQDQALAAATTPSTSTVSCRHPRRFQRGIHPLLEKRDGARELVLVISTDKGLCGALNTNLGKVVSKEASATADFVTVGRKLRVMFEKLGSKVIADFTVKDPVPSRRRAVPSPRPSSPSSSSTGTTTRFPSCVLHPLSVNTIAQQPDERSVDPAA